MKRSEVREHIFRILFCVEFCEKEEFEDQVESCMKINSVKVVASNMETEKNATSWFDIKTDGNKVTAKLKDAKKMIVSINMVSIHLRSMYR